MSAVGKARVCNRALVVSVEKFDARAGLDKRNGTRQDTKRLHRALTHRGFGVTILNDPDAHEILQAFKSESEASVHSCFVGVISSHGEEGVIFGADGRPVRLADIYKLFRGATMASKHKLFLIQACRGTDLDDGVEVEMDSVDSVDSGVSESLSIPPETVVAYATPPGYGAFMHPGGSVFLQTFCDLLEEEVQWEILQLLTRLNHRVAREFEARGKTMRGKKEMPCFISRFTTQCYPFSTVPRVSELLKERHIIPRSCIS